MDSNSSEWAVIFDIDGTMVNNTSYHRNAWFELCRRYDIELDHQSYHEKIHARSNDQIVPKLFGADCGQAMIRRIEKEKESIYRETFKPVMKETPGLTALLTKLQALNVPCAAASNSPIENVDFVLNELGIRHFFRAVTYRDLVKVGKPNPELFLLAAERMNVSPVKCVVFEDSDSGFKAARSAGMKYIAITYGGDRHELKDTYDKAGMYEDFTTIHTKELGRLFE